MAWALDNYEIAGGISAPVWATTGGEHGWDRGPRCSPRFGLWDYRGNGSFTRCDLRCLAGAIHESGKTRNMVMITPHVRNRTTTSRKQLQAVKLLRSNTLFKRNVRDKPTVFNDNLKHLMCILQEQLENSTVRRNTSYYLLFSLPSPATTTEDDVVVLPWHYSPESTVHKATTMHLPSSTTSVGREALDYTWVFRLTIRWI